MAIIFITEPIACNLWPAPNFNNCFVPDYDAAYCAGGTHTFPMPDGDAPPPVDNTIAVSTVPGTVLNGTEGAYPNAHPYDGTGTEPLGQDTYRVKIADQVAWSIGAGPALPATVSLPVNHNISDDISNGESQWIWFTNWGFDVPTDATINKLVLAFESSSSANIWVSNVAIKKGGEIVWVAANTMQNDEKEPDDLNVWVWPLGEYWPTTQTGLLNYFSWKYGISGSTDRSVDFLQTWTGAEINSSDWGFGIAVSAYSNSGTETGTITSARAAVYYTGGSPPPPPPPEDARLQLVGGAFQDSFQNPVANGHMLMELTQSEPYDGYWYENLSPVQICTAIKFTVPLDANGDVVASPASSVYPNDLLTPSNSYYLVSVYTEEGQLVWGPNCQNVLSTLSPLSTTFDVGQWIPNRISET